MGQSSINQSGPELRLPNFCNLGVMLRALLLVNALFVAAAVVRMGPSETFIAQFLSVAALGEPALILSLVLLCVSRPVLSRLRYWLALSIVVAGLCGISLLLRWAQVRFLPNMELLPLPQVLFGFLFVALVVLGYFDMRSRALSPAVTEARLQALQARIRPHFLFNTLNAALSLIRSEPKRAERALEDLAELFRVLMKENRELTTLDKEVALTQQYLDLEALRLGDRLKVAWHIDHMPTDALVPPLLLQPLAENAVYHGIEPREEGGEVSISIIESRGQIVIALANPLAAGQSKHPGNRMATANIRERLQLHFDAEASMKTQTVAGRYQVTITLPYNRGKS